MFRFTACIVLFCVASASQAQIFYQPVQYQHGTENNRYYYGGANPAVHDRANALSHEPGYGRGNTWAFASGNITTHREVSREPARIFTEMIPTLNGRFHGYTETDARNQAYRNAPTYFRKSDLLKTAVRQEDGSWIVPSQPLPAKHGTIVIKRYLAPSTQPSTKPAAGPKPVMIIPKRLLDQPLWPRENPQV